MAPLKLPITPRERMVAGQQRALRGVENDRAWKRLQPLVLHAAEMGNMAEAEALLAEANHYRQGRSFDHSDLIGKVEEWRRAHFLVGQGASLLEGPQDGLRPDYDLKYLTPAGKATTEELKADTYTDTSGRALNLFVELGERWDGLTPQPWHDASLKPSGLFSTKADVYTLARVPLRAWFQASTEAMREVILGGLDSERLKTVSNTRSGRGTWGVRLPVSKWRHMPTGAVIPWPKEEK